MAESIILIPPLSFLAFVLLFHPSRIEVTGEVVFERIILINTRSRFVLRVSNGREH